MNRDVVVTPTRAAFAAGLALALTAAVPALASAPAGASESPSGAVPAASLTPAAAPVPGTTAAAPAAAKKRNRTPDIRPTTERGSGLVGRTAVYGGRVRNHTAGQRVRLEVRRGSAWRAIDRDVVAKNGRFRVSTEIAKIGDRSARLRIVSNSRGKGDIERVERIHGFRSAYASYYGPGLYGGALACGGTLSPGTIGVAHKTLPCGTKLTLRKGNRQVQARVVDRGPYIAGREFDLTAATKYRLGFGSTGTVQVDR
ncbi:septal ring lytic transglycosylase RlpA family protein [Patulibacter sp.]|uniref:septal ring lytic transglycosylase RlpA family protein n=1 Tax=Patulibacter sp. TaxID=1912859 RepID=UPI002720D363|nr:septal ring lytic transglycosylase RlpA family protein [Patulibacter sp.]MDO9410504.1 septal ring lytic transglycosylase RlpA family protein [Patulibacter sp.]